MMNIRGLILDDPGHTTHLQTLEFANHPNSGSEIEESGSKFEADGIHPTLELQDTSHSHTWAE